MSPELLAQLHDIGRTRVAPFAAEVDAGARSPLRPSRR